MIPGDFHTDEHGRKGYMKSETPIISRLKRRFIALAMASLVVLLSVIVAGMNIINYNRVVHDADMRLEIIEQNSDRIKNFQKGPGELGPGMGPGAFGDDVGFGKSGSAENSTSENEFRGPGGRGMMSGDEMAEARFFSVTLDSDGNVSRTDMDRIIAIDADEAGAYAKQAREAAASGKSNGFIGDYRYSVTSDGGSDKVMFLDCGRTLDSFRSFLRASIIMSLAGLALVFIAICYFAGRIVRPVAESYEKQKRFITDAGHEIKTPLAIIKANIDLMNMDLDELTEEEEKKSAKSSGGGGTAVCTSLKDSLSDIDGQVDRLTGLTNDLVYLSRMEEGGNDLVMTEVPFSDIVSETVDSFRALARDNCKAIEVSAEPLLSVRGSAAELEKLVSILMQNAVKYSDGSEPIRLSLKRNGKNLVLEVANKTCEPVTNDELSHVFERFYRNDSSRNSSAGGHGIGLSMASAIVSAHKGRIAARTTDGNDFTVTATLPAA